MALVSQLASQVPGDVRRRGRQYFTRGLVRIAISPWGEVEVDGKRVGTSPPLTELSLTEGRHQIVIRNADLPPHSTTINVTADQPTTLKYKF